MQTREHVLDTLNHDGAKVFAKGMIRQGWNALGEGMHNTVVGIQHSLKNSGRHGIVSSPDGRMRNRPRMPLILTQTTR